MTLKFLPPDIDIETKHVLRQTARSHRALAELKGLSETMPNKNILINAVTLNEAKDSSAIENIITTHDDLFKVMAQTNYGDPAAKEVARFQGFYTKRIFIEEGLGISRLTASNYLKLLDKEGFLKSEKIGREIIYLNPALMNVVRGAGKI